MKKKIKTYVLTLSLTFPATHPRRKEPTYFKEQVLNGISRNWGHRDMYKHHKHKIHTIRANYDLWKKRIEEVQQGKAILSLRYWTGKPYASKQEVIEDINSIDSVGIQLLTFGKSYNPKTDKWDGEYDLALPTVDDACYVAPETLAENDGLDIDDWKNWFKNYDLSKPLAVIHFTCFRY